MPGFGFGLGQQFTPGWPASGGGGGGGDPPEWVREGAIADIDFVNNPPRAWDGTTEIAWEDFDTILGNTTIIPGRDFDPEMIDLGVGYGTDNDVQGKGNFIGTIAAVFNNNFTAVLEYNDNFSLEYVEDDFGTDIVWTDSAVINPTFADAGNDTLGEDLSLRNGANTPINGSAGPHKFGFTITTSAMYAALDGVSLEYAADQTVTDPSATIPPTEISFSAAKLKRLTIYNPIKTEAEQRTLTA